jgi:hypothetical protein
MPLGKNEPVPIGMLRLVRPDVQHTEVKSRQDVDDRHLSANVARARFKDRLKIAQSDLASTALKFSDVHRFL